MKAAPAVAATVMGLLAAQVLLAPSASAGISYVSKLHAPATGQYALYHPRGVAADSIGNVYVADTNNHRVVKFNPDGDPIAVFGVGGPETAGTDGHLYYPESLTWANDKIYVADTAGTDVQVFTTGGTFVKRFGEAGGGDGQFAYPDGITGDCAGNIYVSDGRNHNVQKFDGNGTFIKSFGVLNLAVPIGVAASYRQGTFCINSDIYVADEYGGRIAHFSKDGTFISYIGAPGQGPMQFDHPDQIALQSESENDNTLLLWVAESGSFRVQEIRSADGNSWSFVTQLTHGAQAFNAPHGVAADGAGRVYVANTGENEIYKFRDAAPKLIFGSVGERRSRILRDEDLRFGLRYNQAGKTCHVHVKATVTIPPHASHVFTIEKDTTVGDVHKTLSIKLSDRQVKWIEDAWDAGKDVPVHAKANASCNAGDVHLSKIVDYKI